MKVAFVYDGIVLRICPMGDIYTIAKNNFRNDWQAVVLCADDVQEGWTYDAETETFAGV
jgi:hypothetical protein